MRHWSGKTDAWLANFGGVWQFADNFNQTRQFLADKLLGAKLRRRLDVEPDTPLSIFVVPAISSIDGAGRIPIRISETLQKQTSRDWSQEPASISQKDMVMEFRDFFDWGVHGYWDLQYCLVEITASDRYPDLIGREALIEFIFARILLFPNTVTQAVFSAALGQLIFMEDRS